MRFNSRSQRSNAPRKGHLFQCETNFYNYNNGTNWKFKRGKKRSGPSGEGNGSQVKTCFLAQQPAHFVLIKSLPFRYLENFNEPTSSSSLIHDIPSSVETTAKYAFNPLAVYRIVWRFENYVKHWLTQEPEKQGKLLRRKCRPST